MTMTLNRAKKIIAPYGVLTNAHKLNFPRCSKYCRARNGTILSPWSTGSGTLPTSDASASFTTPFLTVTLTAENTYGGASTSKLYTPSPTSSNRNESVAASRNALRRRCVLPAMT